MGARYRVGIGLLCRPARICRLVDGTTSRFLASIDCYKIPTMDEGTLKTQTPLCRFHWSFCLGWWSNLVGSASVQKQSVKFLQNMIYRAQFNPQPPPPPQTLTVCINSTFSLGRGGGGQREDRGATVHKYSSFVHGGNSSQAGSKIPTNEWMYLHSLKSVKHNAAMYVNRSILKKSRHIGIGLLQCNLSTIPTYAQLAHQKQNEAWLPQKFKW